MEKEEYNIQEMDVDYSMIEYKLPQIKEEHEILKANKNRLYILIHDVEDEESEKLMDSLMVYDFQSEREVKRYNFQNGMKIHDLMVYQGDIYISFGDGEKAFLMNQRKEFPLLIPQTAQKKELKQRIYKKVEKIFCRQIIDKPNPILERVLKTKPILSES